MARLLFGAGGGGDGVEELVESSEAPQSPLGTREYREAYTVKEALPFIAAAVAVVVLVAVVILYAAWLREVWDPSDDAPGDLSLSGSVELRAVEADPDVPYGPHALAVNVTLRAGDVLTAEVTAVGPTDGVEVLIQRPLVPTNASHVPATVMSMGAGARVTLSFVATAPGSYQVYVVHPGAVRPPPAGVDPFDWHVPAQVTYAVRVHRAG